MKENFYTTFANLPIPERKNPIYVSQQYGPMSWYVVKLEVDANTPLGDEALKTLTNLQLI